MDYSHLPKIPGRVLALMVVSALFLLFAANYEEPTISQKDFTVVSINGVKMIVEIARDEPTRIFGLAGRENMGATGGMLFVFGKEDYHAIWMKGMRFPIDIIWIRNGRVADLEEFVPAPGLGAADMFLPVYRPDIPAEYILEVRAGFAQKQKLSIGNRVSIGLSKKTAVPPAPAPGSEFFIENARKKDLRGRDFEIKKALEEKKEYTKYAIAYKVGELTISGIMNIPGGEKPKGGFPLLILNHGLIPPETYFSGRGSRREQDFFAKNGYAVIHPDYRGHASSSPNPDADYDFFSGYTEDALGLIQALKRKGTDLLDLDRIGMWGHSMGGGVAARAMALSSDIRAYVLFAPNSAEVKENFYELSPEQRERLDLKYGTGPKADALYQNMSPLTYFQDVSAPAQFHHGGKDQAVPSKFSERMYKKLIEDGKRAEFFFYPGEKHEFIDAWPLAAERSLQFFDKYVKNTE